MTGIVFSAPVCGTDTGWAIQPGTVTGWLSAKAGGLTSAAPPPSQMTLSGSASLPTTYTPGGVLETSTHW